ncbi:MAG TPA: hypothetical protein VFE25_03360 [Opitutaceae bacterium]|jgi:hypothetical protein|nr:hypothetical protein [Opitutaceae bacterium]
MSELGLGQTDKAPQGRDVLAGLKLALHETPSHTRGYGPGELFLGQLWNVTHRVYMAELGAEAKLDFNGLLDVADIGLRQAAEPLQEPGFADRGQLISHRLALLPIEDYVGFARVQTIHVTGQGNDLNPVQELI